MEKPTIGEKFFALLATGRVANLPTVWSNVLVAFWIASQSTAIYRYREELETTRLLLLFCTIIIASLIYVGGCMLGDARDIEFDRKNRPTRPLPRGIISGQAAKLIAFAMFATALFGIFSSTFISFIASAYIHNELSLRELTSVLWTKSTLHAFQIHEMLIGCALITCVTAYAYFHKRMGKSAIFLMAACRSLLILYAISTAYKTFFDQSSPSADPMKINFGWLEGWMFLLALAVGLYTLLLSWVASTESEKGAFKKRQILSGMFIAIPTLAILLHTLVVFPNPDSYEIWGDTTFENWNRPFEIQKGPFLVTFAALITWILFTLKALSKSKPLFVSRALAGFCLLDACFVAAYSPGIAAICIVLFGFALLLQRVTPAT